jgi:hypothetical protein
MVDKLKYEKVLWFPENETLLIQIAEKSRQKEGLFIGA